VAGLLLGALHAGNFDRLLHGRSAATALQQRGDADQHGGQLQM